MPVDDRAKKPPQATVLLRRVDRRVLKFVCFSSRRHLHLLKLPSMWTRNYFAATVGNVSALIIENYIATQKGL